MTTRTGYPVRCDCGHEGAIRMSENDQSYSANWESYTLVGLVGGTYSVSNRSADWEEVFEQTTPACPKCGGALLPSNLV